MSDERSRRAIRRYWESYLESRADEGGEALRGYQAWSFGNTPEMADRLGGLVRAGVKTATAALAWSYEAGDEPYPRVGEHSVVLDGLGLPICIIQTTELAEIPFRDVDEVHAFREGEGDRSLDDWRKVHWDFFSRECRELGREPDETMPVVCEKFRLVYP